MAKKINIYEIITITQKKQVEKMEQEYDKITNKIDEVITSAANEGDSTVKFFLSSNPDSYIRKRILKDYEEFKPTYQSEIGIGYMDEDPPCFEFSWEVS